MSNLIPLNGNVIIKMIDEEEQMKGNIIIPDMGKERPEVGLVVSSAKTFNWNTSDYVDSQLQPGQKVLIPKMGATKITLDGEDYYITKETEILAIYE